MKRLRDIGTILFGIGWITAIILRYALPQPSPAFVIAGGVAMVGALMIFGTGIARLIIGQVHLRPLEAIKRMPFLFVLYFAIWGIWELAFPDDGRDLKLALVSATVLSIALSFYFSAYRKPE